MPRRDFMALPEQVGIFHLTCLARVLTRSVATPRRLAPWEKEKKGLGRESLGDRAPFGPVSTYAFIETTQVLAKMLLNYAAFKPQEQQVKITARGT
jgi:hypothetical protein